MKPAYFAAIILSTLVVGCSHFPLNQTQDKSVSTNTYKIDHHLNLIAEITQNPIKLGSGAVSAEKQEAYKAAHQKTVICDKQHYYAASNAHSTAEYTTITLVSGEEITINKICWIEKAYPEKAIYVAKQRVKQKI